MARELTKKQKGFVKDYIETGNRGLAAKKNYDVKNDNVARMIGSDNLTKPNIVKAIQDAIPDDLLAQRHLELLNKREIRFSQDGEELSNFPDTQAVTKALDMAYKLKGSYAAEKSTSLNVNVGLDKKDDPAINELMDEYKAKLKAKLIG